jgi:hypothetical protein
MVRQSSLGRLGKLIAVLFSSGLLFPTLCPGVVGGVDINPVGNDIHLNYETAEDSYYRLFSAGSMTGVWSACVFRLGCGDDQSWTHLQALAESSGRYYRVERVLLTNPFDHDGDGLDDVWELQSNLADPLNPDTDGDMLSDGEECHQYQTWLHDPDTDGNGIPDGQEVHYYGTDPASPFSGARVLYSFESDEQGWSGDFGTYGTASVTWTNLGFPDRGAAVIHPAAGTGYGDFYIRDGMEIENFNAIPKPVLRAWFFIPANAPADSVRVQLWVKSTTDDWQAHYDNSFHTLEPGAWTLVSWDMSLLDTDVLGDIDELAVKVVWPNRTLWDAPVLMDTVHVIPLLPETNLPPAITGVSAASVDVGRYDKFELTVEMTNVAGLNPYDPMEVDLEAFFISPSLETNRIWGFYMEEPGDLYGEGKWKVRFAPGMEGTWRYSVRVANRWGTNQWPTSTFTCVSSDRRGWIRVSKDDSHYLEHDDGTAFYGIGYCRPYDADDEGIFADAYEHGVNMIHWWMAPWDTMLTVERATPGRDDSTFYRYEQSRAAQIDRIIGHAEQYDVKLVFTIWTHDALRDFNHHTWRKNGSWALAFDEKLDEPEEYINAFSRLDNPPKNQKFFHDPKYLKYQEHLYRYIIARWGYSEAVGFWQLASELYGTYANSIKSVRWQDPDFVDRKSDLVGQDPYSNMDTNQVDGNDYTLSWTTWIHNYFKTNDPFGHPTTACNETDQYWDKGFEVVDIPQIHAYSESYSWVTPPIMIAKYHHHLRSRFQKPAFMGETGSWKWQTYQPDFLRACIWPALCSGAAVTPMMWTVPAFKKYCDPVMGPWLDSMADEAFLFSRFIRDIDFPRLYMKPTAVQAWYSSSDLNPTLVEGFEGNLDPDWQMFGTGIVSIALITNHATQGTNSLRMNIDMDTWANMTNPASGVYNFNLDMNWSAFWPDGVLRVDLYIPEFYHPTENPDGFLKGINRDPRCIVEIAVESEDGSWRYYSTRNEYAPEHEGWKKLTVGMLYNLELRLDEIPTSYQAARIRGIKIWIGDAGILRGPIYVDNISVGRFAFNTWGMLSSNGQFGIAWIQDRQWTNVDTRDARFQMHGLANGRYNVEWWNSRREDINSANNYLVSTGTLYVSDVPRFRKDIAVKIRRIGSSGDTVRDVSVGCVSQVNWLVRSASSKITVTVVNQGTANESFNVVLSDMTDGKIIGTNRISGLQAGRSATTTFTWNTTDASLGWHTLKIVANAVSGEADLADNELTARVNIVASAPPWDSCRRMRRWAARMDITDAISLTVSTNKSSEGDTSFLLAYAAPTGHEAHAEMWFDNVFENWSGKTKVLADIFPENGASNLQLQIWTGTNWTWYYSWTKSLTNNCWNTNVTFNLNAAEWGTTNGWGATPANLDRVQQILFKFTDYTNAGAVYLDNIRLQ